MGDEAMIRYLFDILKPEDVQTEVKDRQYVVFNIRRGEALSDIDYLLCRQIVRDHGEATHRRGCGISVENQQVKLILPRYHGQV